MSHHLSPTSDIVKHKDFENGIVKLQREYDNMLTPGEIIAMVPFLKPSVEVIVIDEIDGELSMAQEALRLEKRRRTQLYQESIYIDTTFINPTSNDPERLFSYAKLTNGDLRQATTPMNFEARIYLHYNREHWSIQTVQKVINHEPVEDL
jgi:hypothetical protein